MMWSILIVLFLSVQSKVFGDPKVPCFFIFGDSLVDNGNNNQLLTQAKVNYTPYGIDFPNGPTGRFCNGKTVADIIGEQLGFSDFITSYADSSQANVTQGVNYASGSAGIRDETGQHSGEHVSMNFQLMNHHAIRERLFAELGRNAANQHLNKCLYYVGIGNNDYINNYFLPEFYNTKTIFTPEQYAEVLTSQLSEQLTILYNDGARKIAVVGAGNIGCTPDAIKRHAPMQTPCVEEMNVAATIYNNHLKLLVDRLNHNLLDASFTFVNVSAIDIRPGFEIISAAPCCPLNDGSLCIADSIPCPNRNQTAFFDGFHPTEAMNRVVATRAFGSLDQLEAYPTSIGMLFQKQ